MTSIRWTDWIAPDGLCSLNRGGFNTSYFGHLPDTVDNENGILYLVQLMYLYDRDFDFLTALRRLKHGSIPGLYHRHPGGYFPSGHRRVNSHDNYEAQAAGCIFVGETESFKELLPLWPLLNDITPTKYQGRRGEPSGLHQPHSWFLYYLAAGKTPNWFRTVWYIGNLILMCFYPRIAYTHHASRCVAWLRIQAVKRSYHLLPGAKGWAVKLVNQFAEFMMNRKVWKYHKHLNWIVYLEWYHKADHPIAIKARNLRLQYENG